MESTLFGPLRGALCGLAALAISGCAANAELQKEVQSLRTELTALRASNAAMSERLDALEIQGGGLKSNAAAPPPEPPQDSGAPPDLQVVRLKPVPDAGEEPADGGGDSDSRVKIRSTPSGLVQEEVRGPDKDGDAAKSPPAKPPTPAKKDTAKPASPKKPSTEPAPPPKSPSTGPKP
ncbi:MAG: hypothetical protein HOW73_19695 [Polyangiaceae bacterium]|nr:hypothetical protein [Polyangiaceae bacterium]